MFSLATTHGMQQDTSNVTLLYTNVKNIDILVQLIRVKDKIVKGN